MPWKIIKSDGKHCVAKEDEDTPIKGGCHDNAEDAERHMAALHANAGDEAKADLITLAQIAAIKAAVKKANVAPPMLVCAKAITDAPNLRERYAQACLACKSYKEVMQNADASAPTIRENEGICEQYEFETHADWVCDSFEVKPPAIDAAQVAQAVEQIAESAQAVAQAGDNKTGEQSLEQQVQVDSETDTPYAVKFIGADRIRGYQAMWGDPDHPDLSKQKDFFTKSTEFMRAEFPLPRPLFYHHGFDAKTNRDPWVGTIDKEGTDEWGMWYEAQLRDAKNYDQYVANLMGNVRKLIQQGALKTSSDAVPQYTIREPKPNGTHEIKRWALIGASLTTKPAEPRMWAVSELKAAYKSIGVDLNLPEADVVTPAANAGAPADDNAQSVANQNAQEGTEMDEKQVAALVEAQLKAREEAAAKSAADEAEAKKKFDEAVKAQVDAQMQEALKSNPNMRKLQFPEGARISVGSKYDDVDPADLALLATLRIAAKSINRSAGADEELRRALAAKSFKQIEVGKLEAKAMSDAEFKSNEVMQSTLASYGDEWVTTNFSSQLWLKVRGKSRLLDKLPQQEIPKGYESDTIPIESTDFTFYNVSQAATEDSTMKTVPATVTSSKMGTGQKVITVGKLGARGYISGELDEDAIIDALPEARRQLERQLPEELDYVLFNGDSTAATDNINGDGTPVSGADYTTLIGILRLGLKTNTANQKDMGAAIDSTKVNALYQLLGTDGVYVAEDPTLCAVFCDYSTWWKVLGMSDLLTVSNAGEKVATISNGALPDQGIPIFGVKWYPSVGVKKAQATGIRHGTEGSNTLGRAVLMRPDLWKLRWKRRAKFETTRVAYADLTELVVTLRFGIGYFDTDACAVAFNI